MLATTYDATRRSLHGLAELVLAGPRYRATGDMRLTVVAGGFAVRSEPGPRYADGRLVADGVDVPVDGSTFAELAARLGLRAEPLDDVYADGPGVAATEVARVDPDAARTLTRALEVGDAALRALAPAAERVLWPEHFDVALTLDQVNYGVSPGDGHHPRPYAYVGPHQPRQGPFWNAPFGAVLPLEEEPDTGTVLAFFRAGRDQVAEDPA